LTTLKTKDSRCRRPSSYMIWRILQTQSTSVRLSLQKYEMPSRKLTIKKIVDYLKSCGVTEVGER